MVKALYRHNFFRFGFTTAADEPTRYAAIRVG
jgi:hypothetical protein